jgi:hypothetical protein
VNIRHAARRSSGDVQRHEHGEPHVAGGAALDLAIIPVRRRMVSRLELLSTKDKLSGLGPGSPNALLYVRAE